MTDRSEYFDRAASWAVDTRVQSARSHRIAWTVAGVATGVALFEAVALALLAPLKTVQPITLLVDRQTGYVQALDPLTPKRVAADDALTQSYLAQYVAGREGFDRATVSVDYRRVALWSAGGARSAYVAQMPATNPASPFQRYSPGTIVQVRVKSVSRLNPGLALVRFDTQVLDRSGVDAVQPWISTVRFRYIEAPMRLEDRLVNPLGFQVTGYRRDAEAPPPPEALQAAARPITATVTPRISPITPAHSIVGAGQQAAGMPALRSETARRAVRPAPSSFRTPQIYSGELVERREIPANNLPAGSPLSPSPRNVDVMAAGARP